MLIIARGKEKSQRVNFEIKENLLCFPEKEDGWRKELNLVSWYGKAPAYDLRERDREHIKMSKGVTLTKDELMILKERLQEVTL